MKFDDYYSRVNMYRVGLTIRIFVAIITVLRVVVHGQSTDAESSDEYLRNVMLQLQEHNRPAAHNLDRATFQTDYDVVQHPNYVIGNIANDIFPMKPADGGQYYRQYLQSVKPNAPATESSEPPQLPIESVRYYQLSPGQTIPGPVKIIKSPVKIVETPVKIVEPPVKFVEPPEPLDLTQADLAALYEESLRHGTTISLPGLQTSVATRGTPQIIGNHVQLPVNHRGYYYYFYPLKSFMNHLQGHQIYSSTHPVDAENAQPAESKKQLINPLFMAISSFVSLAMLFMASVLFLPKIGKFRSRGYNDEFLELSRIAGEAIAGKNCSARLACELSRAEENLKFPGFVARFFRLVLPSNIREEMERLRRSTKKRSECRLISCKKT